MRQVLVRKFSHPELRAALLSTGDALLVEGNHWGDIFWGVCRGEGENWLGRLLMALRGQMVLTFNLGSVNDTFEPKSIILEGKQ
jgi:predicted NAD-dependent protein-ADP-ribosyltransferase YbiA (DUF1768 family)